MKGLVRWKKLGKYIVKFINKFKNNFKEEDKDLDKDILTTLIFKVMDLFSLIIYNKVYKLKSIQICMYCLVQLIYLKRLLFITITICGN